MASGNAGKIKELSRLLQPLNIEVIAQSAFSIDEAEETATTFAGNSLIKARHAMAATGLPAIADDSGLVVSALDGAPGVFSARYAGPTASDEDNIDKLLSAMQGVEQPQRSAAFHCVATFVAPDWPAPLVTEGRWDGAILTERRGSGGFGYDPVFLDPQSGLSSAELSAEQKNQRSHRGKALQAMVAKLKSRLA